MFKFLKKLYVSINKLNNLKFQSDNGMKYSIKRLKRFQGGDFFAQLYYQDEKIFESLLNLKRNEIEEFFNTIVNHPIFKFTKLECNSFINESKKNNINHIIVNSYDDELNRYGKLSTKKHEFYIWTHEGNYHISKIEEGFIMVTSKDFILDTILDKMTFCYSNGNINVKKTILNDYIEVEIYHNEFRSSYNVKTGIATFCSNKIINNQNTVQTYITIEQYKNELAEQIFKLIVDYNKESFNDLITNYGIDTTQSYHTLKPIFEMILL